jgi:ubiquinone biosynthesis protein
MSMIEKIGDLKRFDHILNVLFKYEFGFFIEKIRLKDRLTLNQRLQKEKFKHNMTQPVMLRKVFEEVGGSFIKFAQFLSVRPDLIPIDYVKEFEKLQDNVPAIDSKEVQKIIENEFKKPLKDIFKEFNETSIASASIAQVHKAILLTGEHVAVKVQRPNIKDTMERDIDLMLLLSEHMEKHNHEIKGVDPRLIVNEFRKWTEKEIDFEQEASNLEVFATNFEKNKNIIIPRLYKEHSTKKVLTMEFIEGIPLTNIEKIKEKKYDMNNIIKIGFNCVLKQVFIDGFFHADPHPGNILVIDNDKIALVDCGIVGIFDEKMKDQATELFIGIVKNDVDRILDTLINMGMDGGNVKILKIELENKLKILQGTELKDVIISRVLSDILGLIQKHGFKIPLDFVLFGKTMMTLEGVALKYDQEFRLTTQSRSFVEKIIKKRKGPKQLIKKLMERTNRLKDFTISIPEKTTILLKRAKEAEINLKYIDRDIRGLIMEMDKSSNRVTFGLIITALIISSTIMLSYDQIKIFEISAFSFIGFSLSGMLILFIVISMLREKRF